MAYKLDKIRVKVKNFVLLGDSGAGKSESLEAIKNLWIASQTSDAITYSSDYGTIEIRKYLRIIFKRICIGHSLIKIELPSFLLIRNSIS